MRAYERLMAYAVYDTVSHEGADTCPSTPEQLVLARALAEEMQGLGVQNVTLDENGYLFGTIPANIPDRKGTVIGFIAHMDVADDVPTAGVKPRLVEGYDGGDLVLNEQEGVVLSPREFDTLKRYVGCDLVVTDGTTLLGADDKAGIAIILTMAEYLRDHPEVPHGELRIGFTPDEEIGQGADLFDVARFGADFAYTVDGAAFGEVEYETFNAASAHVTVTGRSVHTGSAKGVMKNALHMAAQFDALLPAGQRPENTEGYEGFYHLESLQGGVEHAEMSYLLRDHDAALLEQKKQTMLDAAAQLNDRYGPGSVAVQLEDSYRNMAEQIRPHWHLIETAYEAVRQAGGTPVSLPVRGGTDGSRLSFMGLPCPNLGTGSHNHHGRLEYAVVQEMDKAVDCLVRIAVLYGGR